MFQLTSAKENKGIEDVFNKIAEQLDQNTIKRENDEEKGNMKPNKLNVKEKEKKGGCC